ncbi:MAG TPA: glycosyltransferase family 4 protein [Humisphaera sp.]
MPVSIVQVVRDVHTSGGIGGVAHALGEAFERIGVPAEYMTLESVCGLKPRRLERSVLDKCFNLLMQTTFSIAGSWAIRRSRRGPGDRRVFLVHNDAIGGDVYVDHGCHKAVVRQRPTMVLRNPYHVFLLLREEIRHWIGSYRYVVTLSDLSRAVFQSAYAGVPAEKLFAIPNGIDLARFRPADRGPHVAGRLRLLFVGHEFERKGLEFVIRAMPELPDGVTLQVVGGGPHEIAAAERLAASLGVGRRTDFLGKRDDVPSLLAAADVLVLPSRYESWGLVTLEAMASGVIPVCTPTGCVPEVVADGVNGYVVRREPDDIARAVLRLLERGEGIAELRRAARATAERYAWDAIAARYAELAGRVVAEREADA